MENAPDAGILKCRFLVTTVDKNVVYQSEMEAADALDAINMHEQAKMVRDTAEKLLELRNELDALIAETS